MTGPQRSLDNPINPGYYRYRLLITHHVWENAGSLMYGVLCTVVSFSPGYRGTDVAGIRFFSPAPVSSTL